MNKTELRQAELISQQKVVPGTGTLTGVTVSAPITGGGSGPVVPIGATQYDATHVGFVPSPGVNNHSKVLWDDGWFEEGVLDSPLLIEQLTPSDTAVSEAFWSATDTGPNTFNVSVGIELPNNAGVAGDFVVRTGGTGASGAGVESIRYNALLGAATITVTGGVVTIGNHPLEGGVPFVGLKTDDQVFRTGGFSNHIDFLPAASSARGVNTTSFNVSNFLNYITVTEAGLMPDGAGSGTIDLGVDDGGAVYGRLAWRNVIADQFIGSSPAGISALFQTSAVDGSNANPTVVVRGNTGQLAPLFQLQDDFLTPLLTIDPSGTTLATNGGISLLLGTNPATFAPNGNGGQFEVDVNDGMVGTGSYNLAGANGTHTFSSGLNSMIFDSNGLLTGMAVVDAAAFKVGGVAGVSGTITAVSTVTVVNGLITNITP